MASPSTACGTLWRVSSLYLRTTLSHAESHFLHATHAISHLSHACAHVMETLRRYNCLTAQKQSGNFSGGTENLADVFLHDICKRFFFLTVFSFSHKKEMRSGTHLQQPDVFLPGCCEVWSLHHDNTYSLQLGLVGTLSLLAASSSLLLCTMSRTRTHSSCLDLAGCFVSPKSA
jgi:hypothetical protein